MISCLMALCVDGSVSDDEHSDGSDSIFGDCAALFSAVVYACYLVYLRRQIGEKVCV